MNKTLTIVIAAYNMEHYLNRCLDSVVAHSLLEEIEVLLINDGSKDKTLEIALNYEKQFPETVRVIDKPNGGWGTAINRGIAEAKGKYFKTLDADDWYDTQELEQFILLLKSVDVDLIATSFTRIYEGKDNEKDIYPAGLCGKITDFKDYLKARDYTKHLPIQAITFRTKLLQDNPVVISDRYYGDIDYNLIPLVYVDTIYFSQINLYQYFLGREGQSVSLSGYKKNMMDYVNMCKKLTSFYAEHKQEMTEEMRITYFKDNANVIRFAYRLLLSPRFGEKNDTRLKEAKKLDQFLKKTSIELYRNANNIKFKKIIPYIWIWRVTGINLLKFVK
jgi:glycosyltransferase involved in cell wall biosynthesis